VTVYSYGIPQDAAVENGSGSPDIAQSYFWISGSAFNYSFAPYSATVMVLAPSPAQLQMMPMAHGSSQFVFQLQGETGVPYVLQYSSNLMTWTPVSTNTLATGALNITNSVVPSQPEMFWRAVWQP
jgi:hypothetical protein